MKRTVIGLGLAITAANAAGCASDAESVECLPGDLDCSDEAAGGDGKADAWDYRNDPRRLANALNYRLADLPKSGKLDQPVWKSRFPNAPAGMNPIWAETYFPSSQGSTNARWQGAREQSPLEKYDQAFNGTPAVDAQPSSRCGDGAKGAWEAYYAKAGPAAEWHAKYFQGMSNGYNGRDDDGNGKIDECSGGEDGYGPDNTPAGWWGLCHAWTPASILEPEAINPVTYNGVTFHRSDIHALVMTVYDANDAMMLGGRCNAREFKPDNTTGPNDQCGDSNPGAMHVVMTNFLGLADQAIAFDRTAGSEVWNQPIYSYEVTKQAKMSPSEAMRCVGGSGTKYTYNPDAETLYEVRMAINYVVEPSASREVLDMEDHMGSADYHYVLELNDDGKIIGGRYCEDSFADHPDFMWAPIGPSSSNEDRNPYVDLGKVRSLLKLSVEGDGGGGGGGGGGQEFTGTGGEIPDDNTTGISSDIAVSGVSGSGGATVSVDIAHSYRGDLKVVLKKGSHTIKTLHDEQGGSADNLVETYTLSSSELGSDRNGTYTLVVTDNAAQDVGTLKSWKLVF